jgi:hypothetical protein
MWEKINHPISCCSRRGLSLIAFRRSVSIRCSNRFFRLTVDDQDTIGFLKPETSVGEKKSLSGSGAGPRFALFAEMRPPPIPDDLPNRARKKNKSRNYFAQKNGPLSYRCYALATKALTIPSRIQCDAIPQWERAMPSCVGQMPASPLPASAPHRKRAFHSTL